MVFAPVMAADPDSSEEKKVYNLGDVLVHDRSDDVDAATDVQKVTAEDIKDSGASNVIEAIGLIPGIDIFTGGAGVARVNIRGFRTRHVLLLLDGIPINAAYDQQFDASIIPVEHIARIETTLGPSSVLFGQGGAGGVINIITKKGTKGLQGMIGGGLGSGNSSLRKASISGSGKNADFFLSGSSSERNSYPLSKDFIKTPQEDGGDRENSSKRNNYFFGKAGYDINDRFNVGLTSSYNNGKYDIPGGVRSDPADDFAPNPKYERIEDLDGYSLQLSGEYRVNNFFGIRSWAFVNHGSEFDSRYDSASFNVNDTPLNNSWQYRIQQSTTIKGVTLQPGFNFEEYGNIKLGFSQESDEWEKTGKEKNGYIPFSFPPRWNILYPDETKSFDVRSAAFEYNVMLFSKLGVVMGYAHHSHDRDRHDDSEYSILTGLHYNISGTLRLKSAFQRNIRFPSLRQLYDKESGNQNLDTEIVHHYTLGMDKDLPGNSSLSLNIFKSVADNFIEKDKIDGVFKNHDHYLFNGGEITAETRIIPNTMIGSSYSYLYTKDLSGSGRDELQNRPAHRITLQGKYNFDFGLSPYVSLLYVSDQYYYARRGDISRKAKMDSYTIVNVKLTQKLFNGKTDIYICADNVFDLNYEQSYGFPQPGRTITTGMEIRF